MKTFQLVKKATLFAKRNKLNKKKMNVYVVFDMGDIKPEKP